MTKSRDKYIDIGVELAETGMEYLGFKGIACRVGLTAQSIYHHFPGGTYDLRSSVVERAIERRNRRIIVQLIAMHDPAVKGYRLVDFI